jgi:hypothetical protein
MKRSYLLVISLIVLIVPGNFLLLSEKKENNQEPKNNLEPFREAIDSENITNKLVREESNSKASSTKLNKYYISAELDPVTKIVPGLMTLNYTNIENVPLTKLVFHLHPKAYAPTGNLIIHEVSLESVGPLISDWQIIDTRMEVIFADVIAVEQSVLLSINFTTIIPFTSGRFGYTNNPESYMITNWFPVLAVYDQFGWDTSPFSFSGESFYYDIANFDLTFTVPDDFVVACSLRRNSLQYVGGKAIFNYYARNTREIAIAVSPEFATSAYNWNGVVITSYYFDEPDFAVRGVEARQIAKRALEKYSVMYGDYLWNSFSVVQFVGGGGMEYPGLVLIGMNYYFEESPGESFIEVIVHEIAHQYIPFIIGTNSFLEPCIDEPFAVWTSMEYFAEIGNELYADIFLNNMLEDYYAYGLGLYNDLKIYQDMGYWGSAPGYSYWAGIYRKGPLVLEMLRQHLGTTTFLNCYKRLYNEKAMDNIYLEEMIELFSDEAGQNLDWFFNQWFYHKGIPNIDILSAKIYGKTITVELNNSGPDWFKLPLSLNITTPFETIIQPIWFNGSKTTIHIPLTNGTTSGIVTIMENKLLLRMNADQAITAELIVATYATGVSSLMFGLLLLNTLLFVVVIKRKKRG